MAVASTDYVQAKPPILRPTEDLPFRSTQNEKKHKTRAEEFVLLLVHSVIISKHMIRSSHSPSAAASFAGLAPCTPVSPKPGMSGLGEWLALEETSGQTSSIHYCSSRAFLHRAVAISLTSVKLKPTLLRKHGQQTGGLPTHSSSQGKWTQRNKAETGQW
jgi:hypothetical protein